MGTKLTREEKQTTKRIERAYYARCSGIQIDIMDIGKVFKDAGAFLAEHPSTTDEELGHWVRSFVETIRKN